MEQGWNEGSGRKQKTMNERKRKTGTKEDPVIQSSKEKESKQHVYFLKSIFFPAQSKFQ